MVLFLPFLVRIKDGDSIPKDHQLALSIISVVGCTIAFVCFVLVLLALIVSRLVRWKYRPRVSSKSRPRDWSKFGQTPTWIGLVYIRRQLETWKGPHVNWLLLNVIALWTMLFNDLERCRTLCKDVSAAELIVVIITGTKQVFLHQQKEDWNSQRPQEFRFCADPCAVFLPGFLRRRAGQGRDESCLWHTLRKAEKSNVHLSVGLTRLPEHITGCFSKMTNGITKSY